MLNLEILLSARGEQPYFIYITLHDLTRSVYAMYERSVRLAVFLAAFLSAKSIAVITLAVKASKEVSFDGETCLVHSVPFATTVIWYVPHSVIHERDKNRDSRPAS